MTSSRTFQDAWLTISSRIETTLSVLQIGVRGYARIIWQRSLQHQSALERLNCVAQYGERKQRLIKAGSIPFFMDNHSSCSTYQTISAEDAVDQLARLYIVCKHAEHDNIREENRARMEGNRLAKKQLDETMALAKEVCSTTREYMNATQVLVQETAKAKELLLAILADIQSYIQSQIDAHFSNIYENVRQRPLPEIQLLVNQAVQEHMATAKSAKERVLENPMKR